MGDNNGILYSHSSVDMPRRDGIQNRRLLNSATNSNCGQFDDTPITTKQCEAISVQCENGMVCAGGGRTATSVGKQSMRRRGQRPARTVKLAGVAVCDCVVKYAGKSKDSTGRDHRVSSSILGHQLAMVGRSTSLRCGGTHESSAKQRRWARRASEVRVARVEKII